MLAIFRCAVSYTSTQVVVVLYMRTFMSGDVYSLFEAIAA